MEIPLRHVQQQDEREELHVIDQDVVMSVMQVHQLLLWVIVIQQGDQLQIQVVHRITKLVKDRDVVQLEHDGIHIIILYPQQVLIVQVVPDAAI